MELSLKLSVPLTIGLGGWYLGTINDTRQNAIAQKNREAEVKRAEDSQKDAVIRDYIKEMKGMLLDKTVAKEAKQPGSEANGVARALTLTALKQLKGEDPDRRSLIFQFLKDSNFPILAGSFKKEGANLASYDLRGANLRGANLDGADLSGASLREANLSWANLYWADLSGADISGADLRKVNLRRASLSRADLSKATLIRANLYGADLSKANLIRAYLNGADLSGAYLSWAVLSGADLSGADLSGADLSDANLIRANLSEVRWSKETKWPDKAAFTGAKNIPPELKKQLGLN